MKRKHLLIGVVAVCLLLVGSVSGVLAFDALTGFNKEFEAIGNSIASSNSSCSASIATTGELRGSVFGTGTYALCLNPDSLGGAGKAPAGSGAAPAAPAAGGSAAPPAAGGGTGGTLVFTDEDGDSNFTLDLAGITLSDNSTILGTYVVDPTQSTGKFANQVKGGSDTIELSTTGTNDTILVDGVIIGH